MKRSRIAAWALAAVMAVSTATAYVPANAAVKVKKVTVASSLSGDKKTVVVAKGKSVKLATTVTVKPNKKANKKVSYSVKNKKIATVTKKGVVKGKKAGTTKVTVTSLKNKKKKAVITVKVMKSAVKKVTMNTKKAALKVGQTLKVKTTVKAGKGACKTLAYTTSKKKVATVSKKGVVKAVGVGSATITAKAIDGSGKKATCKVTVSNPVNLASMPVNLASMNVLNARSVTFALDKPFALAKDQIIVKKKTFATGNYNNTVQINDMTTADNINYTLVLGNDSYISVGSFVQVAVPGLTGSVKSLEMEYKDQVCAFTNEEISAWKAKTYGSDTFTFGERGNSTYAITTLPAGLTAQMVDDGLMVKGVPESTGTADATLTAVDELGNTLTKTIHFIIGDDYTIAAAANQEYTLIGTGTAAAYATIKATGAGGGYRYLVVSDPSNIVANKDSEGYLGSFYWSSDSGSYRRDSDSVSIKVMLPGTYTVTVRVVSKKDSSKYADVNVVFNIKQGITVGGALKDALGNPMASGYIGFTNKDRASRYCSYVVARFDEDSSTYSALVDPGVYDVEAYYGFNIKGDVYDDNYYEAGTSDEYTLSRKYLYSQPLMTTGTGYDVQLDNLYKVAVTVPDYDYYLTLYNNNVPVGKVYRSGIIYLKNGTYTLESKALDQDGKDVADPNNSWFNGYKYTYTSAGKYKFTSTITVNNSTVATALAKTPVASTDAPKVTTKKGAKDTTYSVTELNKYYDLADAYYYVDGIKYYYYAYQFVPSATAAYTIVQQDDEQHPISFYDATGNEVAKAADGSYTLTAGTTYFIGAGNLGGSTHIFKITN